MPVKTGEEFDVNEYWDVLTHLSVQQGYVLDYVYSMDGHLMAGRPIVYARPKTDPPYRTSAEWSQGAGDTAHSNWADEYLNWVRTDGTPEGFVELIVLQIMGDQFYLYQHTAYHDARVICNNAQLVEILSELPVCTGRDQYCITKKQKRQAHSIRADPVVQSVTSFIAYTLNEGRSGPLP
jgi:hypothetical protein